MTLTRQNKSTLVFRRPGCCCWALMQTSEAAGPVRLSRPRRRRCCPSVSGPAPARAQRRRSSPSSSLAVPTPVPTGCGSTRARPPVTAYHAGWTKVRGRHWPTCAAVRGVWRRCVRASSDNVSLLTGSTALSRTPTACRCRPALKPR